MLLPTEGMLAVGAEPSVRPSLALGTGKICFSASPAVFVPSAGLEMPVAESPDPFSAAVSST
jgi:hypothetical protein